MLTVLSKDDLGVDKVILEESSEACDFYIVEYKSRNFLLAVYKGKWAYYAKIALPYTGDWNCEWILYTPAGLFVFSRDENELKLKIRESLLKLYDVVVNRLRSYYQ